MSILVLTVVCLKHVKALGYQKTSHHVSVVSLWDRDSDRSSGGFQFITEMPEGGNLASWSCRVYLGCGSAPCSEQGQLQLDQISELCPS